MKRFLKKSVSRILGILLCIILTGSISLAQKNTIEITTTSKNALKLFKEGRELLENSANEMAEEKLVEAIKLDPDFLMAHVYMGILKNDPSEYDSYRKKIKTGISKVSEGEEIFIDYAESYIAKDVFSMEQAISKLIGMYPDDPRIHNYYGITNYYSSKFEIAANYFNNALQINKNMAVSFNMLGYTYMRMGKYELAEEMFKKYIESHPELANPYDSYADFLLKQGRYDEAIVNFEKSLSIRPAFWNSLNLLGELYLNNKDFEKARYYFKKITEIQETKANRFNAMFMLAYTEIIAREINKAVQIFDDIAIKGKEEHYKQATASAIAQKGFLLAENNQTEKGYKFMISAISMIDENQIRCLDPMCSVWKVYHLSKKGNLVDAKVELDNMQDVVFEAKSLEAYNLWFTSEGYLNYQSKNIDKAVKSLKKGAENSFTWYHLGLSLEEKGSIAEAKKYLNKIIDAREFDIFRAVYLNKAEDEIGKL